MVNIKRSGGDASGKRHKRSEAIRLWLLRLFTPGVRCGREEFISAVMLITAALPLLFAPGLMWLGTGVSVYDYGTGVPTESESIRLFLWGTLQILCLVPAAALTALIPILACRRLLDAGLSRWLAIVLLIPPMPVSTLCILLLLALLPTRKKVKQ